MNQFMDQSDSIKTKLSDDMVVDTIRELRHALVVAANRYHDLHNRCGYAVQNELEFRRFVEYTLKISDDFKPDHETGDPLDWRGVKNDTQ